MNDRRSSAAIIDLGSATYGGHPSLRSIGRYSLLEWTVKRLASSSLLDAIVITGSTAYTQLVEGLEIAPARWISSESQYTVWIDASTLPS